MATTEEKERVRDAEPSTLDAALFAAQKAIAGVQMMGKGEHGEALARTEDIIAEARKVLHNNGLMVMRDSWSFKSVDGIPLSTISVGAEVYYALMRFTLRHIESGETETFDVECPVWAHKGMKIDKALNATLTTSLGYFLRDLLLIPRPIGPVVDDSNGGDDKGRGPTPLGIDFARKARSRLADIGKNEEELRAALSPHFAGLEGGMENWPAGLANQILRRIDRSEAAQKKPEEAQPGPAAKQETPPPEEPKKKRTPWTVPTGINPSPAHPLYWRKKLLESAAKAIATGAKDVAGEEPENLVGCMEEQLQLPSPETASAAQAVVEYQRAFKATEEKDFDWSKFTIPF